MPLIYPVGFLKTSGTWTTVSTNSSLASDQASWASFTIVIFIPQASISASGGTQTRLTLTAPTSGNTPITAMYVGQADAAYSGTAPAFAATPTQLLFTGSASVTLTGGTGDTVSDAASFVMPSSQGLAVAWQHSAAASSLRIATANNPANWKMSYKAGADAATVAKSGYIDYTATDGTCTVHIVEELI